MADNIGNVVIEKNVVQKVEDSTLIKIVKLSTLCITAVGAMYWAIRNTFFRKDVSNEMMVDDVCGNKWEEYLITDQIYKKDLKISKKNDIEQKRVERLQKQLERIYIREKELQYKVGESKYHDALLLELEENKKRIERELKKLKISNDINNKNTIEEDKKEKCIKKIENTEFSIFSQEGMQESSVSKSNNNKMEYPQLQTSRELFKYKTIKSEVEELPLEKALKNNLKFEKEALMMKSYITEHNFKRMQDDGNYEIIEDKIPNSESSDYQYSE